MTGATPLDFPDNTLKQILALLNLENQVGKTSWFDSIAISKMLLDSYGISLHYRTIDSILKLNPDFVARKKNKKQWCYKILSLGEDLLTNINKVYMIDPDKPVESITTIHDIMKNLSGQVMICDPYFDKNSLNFIDSIPTSNIVHVLTQNISTSGEFNSMVIGLQRKGLVLNIRKVTKKVLHDRYILDKNRIFFLGTSLNGFGNKQSFIFTMKSEIRDSTETIFLKYWNSALIVV